MMDYCFHTPQQGIGDQRKVEGNKRIRGGVSAGWTLSRKIASPAGASPCAACVACAVLSPCLAVLTIALPDWQMPAVQVLASKISQTIKKRKQRASLRALYEAVFAGPPGGLAFAGNVETAIDFRQMGLYGFGGEVKGAGNFFLGQPAGQLHQDINLAVR